MKILVTGSSGLIGSEVCEYFDSLEFEIHGVDNDQRSVFFGKQGSTRWNQKRLESSLMNFTHHEVDIRHRENVLNLMKEIKPDAIVHAAAQPSHERASSIPFDDFDTNAVGTLNLLEGTRRSVPNSPFIFLSTNKVYGDAPNKISMHEYETRWDFANSDFINGINETLTIDQSMHSIFGASKVAADVMVQEYGRYFDMPTCCLRGGCLTGPSHSGLELHGFLSYLIRCNIEDRQYKIFGYKGKQVRDNIHSHDVAKFIDAFIDSPRCGEVYNIGGGKQNTCSILEAFNLVEERTNKPMDYVYVDENRLGDHICYYTDLTKIRNHYPEWDITVSLPEIFDQLVFSWQKRSK
ncbi:MAG: NAD-dependent epimerase/dehydratase family protein [Balneolaceae bacterium]|nr:NAD-dependent epimerase/dehydratase family protein [Balneolaceae bacterium]